MFPFESVAKVLKERYVEARLHTDMTEAMPVYARYNTRIQGLRDKYIGKGNVGIPQYFILKPDDLDHPLARRPGSAGVSTFLKLFAAAEANVGG